MTSEVTRREIASWPLGEPFALWPRMQAITLEVIMRAVFGELDTDHLRRLRELLRRADRMDERPARARPCWRPSARARWSATAAFGP